jgi:hypothetical protein
MPSGQADWATPSLRRAGEQAGLFRKRNAGLEGIAVLPDELVLAAEREPRGLLEWKTGTTPQVSAYTTPTARCPAPRGRPDDFADLSLSGDQLFVLERNAQLVVRLSRSNGRWTEASAWSYAETENDPRFAYEGSAFGLGEGLALDAEHVYIVLDNNNQRRAGTRDDRRAQLFVFRRP